MINNIELFEKCIENKESYIDPYYNKLDNKLITDNPSKINKIMISNKSLLENITAYKIAMISNNLEMKRIIIENIIKELAVPGINYSEFVSYWSVKDISYSIYNKILFNKDLKSEFLEMIVPEFIKDRHDIYTNHGYTATTLQVMYDSKSHKRNGDAGKIKIEDILRNTGFNYLNSNNLIEFEKNDKIFIFPDRTEKILFNEIIKKYNINFNWSKNHENKKTDILIKNRNIFYIVEHKHMKESGGGQDKQMSEIIDFISYKDLNVSYISFLDGIYFNVIADQDNKSGKPFIQKQSIIKNLENNKQNFFVNTYGFNELLKSLKN